MFTLTYVLLAALSLFPRLIYGHISIWHPSMWGFNVTDKTFPYDNRPVAPLMNYTFEQWWFHGHLDHPPNDGDVFELPAGGTATTELACNKGATSFFASSEGGDIRSGDDPCPNSPMAEWHTTGIDDLFGCSLAIAYKSDVTQVQPEDFTVFSVNQTCVWTRFTDFQVPQRMPPCPEGGCICAWFWIHSPDSGGEQNYMNGFKCNITGSSSNVALATPQLPRRCGADPANGKMQSAPGNCTYGAKQPFYWFQAERNNMFEGTYAPPRYLDMYNFKDGAQDDIFADSYPSGIPAPNPNSTVVPTPFLGGSNPPQLATAVSSVSLSSSSAAASSLSSVPPSSASSMSPTSLSVSVSVSTATVVSTAVVTVTQLPSSSTPSPTSTATVVNTIFMTVTASAVPSSSTAAGVSTSTATVFVTASSVAGNASFAQLDRVVDDDVADSPTDSSAVASSLPTESAASQMCKRGSIPSGNPLRRRTSSFFSIPGVGKHRKMQKRSDVWNLVF